MQDLTRFELVPALEAVVTEFLTAFPESSVVDGRRDRFQQADRMAGLVLAGEAAQKGLALPKGLARWGIAVLAGGWGIRGTYLASPVLDAVVGVLKRNPGVTNRGALAALFDLAFDPFTPAELGRVSRHLSGEAADLDRKCFTPVRWKQVRAWFAGHPEVKVLYEEGGMPRLHVQLRA